MEMSGEELRKARETGRMPHKHAELIKAWADGAEIQCRRHSSCDWTDLVGGSPSWFHDWEYRIKPKTIKYRNFLWTPQYTWEPSKRVICVCSEQEHLDEPRTTWSGFIKWLGDWQEVEV